MDHTITTSSDETFIFNRDEFMYSIDHVFEEITKQEINMWNSTQGVHIPVEDGIDNGVEEELLSVGRGSFHSSAFNPDAKLFLMRYASLTKDIHTYFRKLEKEHACLYLSGRRAHFQNLRLHDNEQRQMSVASSDDGLVMSASRGLARVHSLRDDERFVYRCSLIAAQFPMLSAPTPPDDNSPSPPLPIFPIGTAPSESSIAMSQRNPDPPLPVKGEVMTVIEPVNQTTPSATPSAFKPVEGNSPIKIPTVRVKTPIRSKSLRSNSNKKHWPSRSTSHRSYDSDSDGEYDQHHRSSRTNDHSDDEVMRLCQSRGSKYLEPLGRDQPFPAMVNREMLCSLVRRSFNQTEEQQIQYEQILRHENGRKSKGEILARELVAQLEILENNAHPFYKPRNFVTRNGYDVWLQSEKQRIRDQLDRFWHYKLPTPVAWSRSTPYDYHKAYILLQEKIIGSESKSSRREPIHGGRTPSGPLSSTAQRLLMEFGLRYGVGELYQQIVYLEYLAKHFDYEVWYIRHCTEQLRLIRLLIPMNRSKTTATRKEMEILRNTVYLLHGQTDNSLTRIDRLFLESDPQMGVATLIDLLKEVLDAEQSLFNQRVKSIDDSLQKYLKAGFTIRYERRKEIISDEISVSHSNTPFELCPILVNALLLSIREEVNDYREAYQAVFRRYFNIVPFAQTEFYRLLCADACSVCAKAVYSSASRQKLDLEMLGLMYRLNERDIEWTSVIPSEIQQWRNQFIHLALIWVDVLAKQIKQWILSSLEEDQWAILTFYSLTDQIPDSIDAISPDSPFTVPLRVGPPSRGSTHHPPTPSRSSSAFSAVRVQQRPHPPSPLSERSGGIPTELSSSSQLSCDSDSVKSDDRETHDLLKFSKSEPDTPVVPDHTHNDHDHVPRVSDDIEHSMKVEESATPTNQSTEEEGDTFSDEVKSKFPSRIFVPVRGPIPVSHQLPATPTYINPVVKLPHDPPHISIVPNLSDSMRFYQDHTPSRPSSGTSRISESPRISPTSVSSTSSRLSPYYFPVSSSPLDLVTSLLRVSSFVGSMITVLTPHRRHEVHQFGIEESLEVPREVMQARKMANTIQQHRENMKIEFLRKIHKVLLNSVKMYVDNMLCMDLCCWSRRDAITLLGEEVLYTLQRRMECGEIWGCRHVVEARNGLHPNGLPCTRNSKTDIESISRDMCIRVNNVHMLLSIFPSLETSVYNNTVMDSSSTPNHASESGECSMMLDGKPPNFSSSHAFPHRFHHEKRMKSTNKPITVLPTYGDENIPTSSDTGTTTRSGMGMTPLSRRKIETGFQSNESNQLIEYLKIVQKCQLKMICIRMNRFFKPALHQLLDLKLSDCPIERRLDPLTTFVKRHCKALEKYLYIECFTQLMNYLWVYILEDIENEVVELIKLKKRVVAKAVMLLETTSHLIKIFHREGGNLSLEMLTSSTEYVLTLINIFMTPTNKLIQSFNRMSSPHFTQDLINLDQSPVAIEPKLIYDLCKSLHGERKCFTGEQFVTKLMKIGQDHDNVQHCTSTPTNTDFINYDVSYSVKLGQYLLSEGILVCLYSYESLTDTSTAATSTDSLSRIHAMDTTLHGDRLTTPPGTSSSISSTPDSYDVPTPIDPAHPPQFKNSSRVFYRFINMEDSLAEGSFFQRLQILSATTLKRQENRMNISEFDHARFGTMFLIIDVCANRSKKDRSAKEFLQRDETVRISNQRVGNNINCLKIFRI